MARVFSVMWQVDLSSLGSFLSQWQLDVYNPRKSLEKRQKPNDASFRDTRRRNDDGDGELYRQYRQSYNFCYRHTERS